jgi:hypothetical protein
LTSPRLARLRLDDGEVARMSVELKLLDRIEKSGALDLDGVGPTACSSQCRCGRAASVIGRTGVTPASAA